MSAVIDLARNFHTEYGTVAVTPQVRTQDRYDKDAGVTVATQVPCVTVFGQLTINRVAYRLDATVALDGHRFTYHSRPWTTLDNDHRELITRSVGRPTSNPYITDRTPTRKAREVAWDLLDTIAVTVTADDIEAAARQDLADRLRTARRARDLAAKSLADAEDGVRLAEIALYLAHLDADTRATATRLADGWAGTADDLDAAVAAVLGR